VKRAVFLDRDGVINRTLVRDGKPFPPLDITDFELLPDVTEACALLKKAGFLLVVVSNQPDVGRGIAAREKVEAINEEVRSALPIDRVEVCYDGDDASEFRKPNPGMLKRAAAALDVDLRASFMIGDRWRDVDCGRAAGCTTIFIDKGYTESLRSQPHFRTHNLFEAATLILELAAQASPNTVPSR
jgi:D-glycero-D-manno-heptose 1,7-bisphosphate phosphatase